MVTHKPIFSRDEDDLKKLNIGGFLDERAQRWSRRWSRVPLSVLPSSQLSYQ